MAPKPAVNLDDIFHQLPCHTDAAYPGHPDGFSPDAPDPKGTSPPQLFPNFNMRSPRRNQNNIEGHLCIAAKDTNDLTQA